MQRASASLAPPPVRPRLGLRLRARLILLVLGTIVPLIGFTLARRYVVYDEAVENARQRTLATARAMASVVEQEIHTRIAVLKVLARAASLRAGDLAGFRARAEQVVAEQFPGANIVLVHEDRRQVMNLQVPPGAPLPMRPDLEADRKLFATRQPTVSDFYQGAIRQLPRIAIDVPVTDSEGTVTLALTMSPRLDDFADMIRRHRLPEGWVASVLDRRGVTIARIPSGDKYVGLPASQSLVPYLIEHDEGTLENRSLEGMPVLSAFSHLPGIGWSVAIGLPRAELTEPALTAALRT